MGVGAAHAVLQVALEDLRAELEDAVPELERETCALLHSDSAAESFGDDMAQQCAAAHGRADAHAALLVQLASAVGTLGRCETELPRLREYEASPPDAKVLALAARAAVKAKRGLQRARQDYEDDSRNEYAEAAELQELQREHDEEEDRIKRIATLRSGAAFPGVDMTN